jgi:hypothetical protein
VHNIDTVPSCTVDRKWQGILMKDYERHIEKLRKDAAECALVRDLATDKAKREMFDRLALHLNQLADEVEQAAHALKTS